MAVVGQSDGSSPINAPGTDGGGTGVPDNGTILNVTNLANAVSRDIAGVYATVNSPAPPAGYVYGTTPGALTGQTFLGFGIVPLLLIGVAAWLIFK